MITGGLLVMVGGLIGYGLHAALMRPNPLYVRQILGGEIRNRGKERRFRIDAAHS